MREVKHEIRCKITAFQTLLQESVQPLDTSVQPLDGFFFICVFFSNFAAKNGARPRILNCMTKQELEKSKELARLYYAAGDTQEVVAKRVGVSRNTINRWGSEGGWDVQRAAKTITRKEVVNKMLQKINERLDSSDWTPDELAKAAAAIQKLDKQTNIVTVIEVFASYNNWLCSRMRIDPDLTPELVGLMTKYQDIFINENSNQSVEFK